MIDLGATLPIPNCNSSKSLLGIETKDQIAIALFLPIYPIFFTS